MTTPSPSSASSRSIRAPVAYRRTRTELARSARTTSSPRWSLTGSDAPDQGDPATESQFCRSRNSTSISPSPRWRSALRSGVLIDSSGGLSMGLFNSARTDSPPSAQDGDLLIAGRCNERLCFRKSSGQGARPVQIEFGEHIVEHEERRHTGDL